MTSRWWYLFTMMVVATLLVALTPVAPTQAQNRICFNEVPHCIEGRFAEYWQQNGGLPIFGFPITPVFEREVEGKMRLVQFFERNRFELHPENPRPYDVLLGRLGDELLQLRGTPWQNEPKAPTTQKAGCRYFAETQHLVCDAFLRYWQSHGLEFDGKRGFSEAESLALFGLPLTEARVETNSSGDTVLTQWFERARFELHTNLGPDVVLLGLLGREMSVPRPLPRPTPTPGPSDPCSTVPPAVNGSIAPHCMPIRSGLGITYAGRGFAPREPVNVYLLHVDTGEVVDYGINFANWNGTHQADADGDYIPSAFYPKPDWRLGLYAIVMEGLGSGHKALLYFMLFQ